MSMVTLVSGGLDSTLMAVMAKEEKIDQFPLFIDYGQRARKREWAACQRVFHKHGLPVPTRMDVHGYGKVIPSGITNRKLRVYEDAFLPGRNLLFLLAGASFAYQRNCSTVAIGLLSDAHFLFPDQTGDFLKKAQQLIQFTIGRKVRLLAPLMKLNKSETIRLAKKRRIKGTYSCHVGGPTPCGKCVSCREFSSAEN